MKANKRVGIQTALSIGIGIITTQLLSIDKPYWTLLTIILLICPRYEQTLYKSFLRIISTVLGSTFCGIFLCFFASQYAYISLSFFSAYFVIFYGKISYPKTIFFASIMVISTLGIFDPWSWTLVISRIYQTFLGGCIAIAVSIFVSPATNRNDFFTTIKDILYQEILFYKEGSAIFFSYDKYWEVLKRNRKNLADLRKSEIEIYFKRVITFRFRNNFQLSKILYRNLIITADIFFVLNKIKIEKKNYQLYVDLFHSIVAKDFNDISELLDLKIYSAEPTNLKNFLPTDIDYLSVLDFSEKLSENLKITQKMIIKSQNES